MARTATARNRRSKAEVQQEFESIRREATAELRVKALEEIVARPTSDDARAGAARA